MSRRVMAAGGGAAILVLVLWYFLLWSPRQSDVEEARDRADAAELERDDLEVRLRNLEDLSEGEALKRSQLEALRVAVPDQPNLAQFILDANDAASQAGISFLTISPTQPTAEAATAGGAVPITLSIAVSGGYFQVLDYLNRLDDLPRILVVDSLNVQGGSAAATSGTTTLSVSITARMFVTAEGVPVAPPGGAEGGDGGDGGGTTTTTAPTTGGTTTLPTGVAPTLSPGGESPPGTEPL